MSDSVDPWRIDEPVVDAVSEGGAIAPSGPQVPELAAQRRARKEAVAASFDLAPEFESPLIGSPAFFRRAEDQLWTSTKLGLELSGAVLARRQGAYTILEGLQRRASGAPGRVIVNPEWGQILWHTHPGLRGSLAAFSNADIEVAKTGKRPLLVIGFGGLSPDVLTTLTLPLGVKGLVLSSAVKSLLALEKRGKLERRFLRMGVAARVVYPSGKVKRVIRQEATPLGHALDDIAFLVDQGVGNVERVGQKALKRAIEIAQKPFER